jgi:hypothetical protein
MPCGPPGPHLSPTHDPARGQAQIVASAQPALRGFLQSVLDEMALRQGFGRDAARRSEIGIGRTAPVTR